MAAFFTLYLLQHKPRYMNMKSVLALIIIVFVINQPSVCQEHDKSPFAHTFSILAYDSVSGDMAVAVQSHWFSVGTTVAWGEAGVGVIATQAVTNIEFGPRGLYLLKSGMSPQQVLDTLLKSDPEREIRQVAILDKHGNTAVYTGKNCVSEAGFYKGRFFSTQANMVKDRNVWKEMAKAFETGQGSFEEKIVSALDAGQSVGGDIRGKQSACLLVVKATPTGKSWIDRKVDLRVDDNEAPIKELSRLVKIHNAYSKMNLGYYALAKGNLNEADAYINTAQGLYPENRELSFWYAVELCNIGEIDRALPIFRQTFQTDPNWKNIILPRITQAGVLKVAKKDLDRINSL
jgi:uncharacterized Ntn-hydrolase superfamily protein